MKVGDVVSRDVATVSCKATISEAAKLMLDRGISWLPVVNEEGRLIGMVTDGACSGAAKSGPSTILVYEAGVRSQTRDGGRQGQFRHRARRDAPGRRQKPGLWCRQKLFELMQKFAISGKVTRRILLLHFSEHSACSVESVGIRLDIGR